MHADNSMDGPVEIANFRTKLEAEMAGGLLENAGIPFLIQSTEGMLHGPINPGATLLVGREMVAQAKAVLGKADESDESQPQDVA